MKPMLTLIPRGDDIAMCESANLGVLDAITNGVLCNISVMGTGPALAHAAATLATLPGVCVGLHVALNCEWLTPRWGNVLPVAQVPSLAKSDGTQFETPNLLHDRGYALDEAIAEVTAQLAAVRAVGFTVAYLDEHMGVGWIDGLRPALADLCRREGLIDADALKLRGLPGNGPVLPRLQAAGDGPWRVIGHPCLPGPDLQHFVLPGQQPGDTARDRDGQRRMFMAPDLVAAVRSGEVRTLRFDQI